MKEHPIIFSSEMVRAILDGRKTQTRRILNEKSVDVIAIEHESENKWRPYYSYSADCGQRIVHKHQPKSWFHKCPYGQVGDRLWVREAQYIDCNSFKNKTISGCYIADSTRFERTQLNDREWELYRKRKRRIGSCASRFMYKSIARIFLEITNIRVERVQDISEEDIKAEGIRKCLKMNSFSGLRYEEITPEELNPRIYGPFISLWNRLNAKRGYGWDKNPWVWVIEFKRL